MFISTSLGSLSLLNLENLSLSLRVQSNLNRADIKTVADLCNLTENDVLNIRNINEKTLAYIKQALKNIIYL